MTKGKIAIYATGLCLLTALGIAGSRTLNVRAENNVSQPAARPALSVNVVRPAWRDMPVTLTANGSIAAWQEAIIGSEVADLHLKEVRAQVGDNVQKGQILAVFEDESVLADVAQSRAVVAEAEANLSEAGLNAGRARQVSGSGALSDQQIDQYLSSEKTARAKLQSAKAQLDAQLLRLKYTKVLASDDGVISSRSATLGAVAAKGQELYRMIRRNRLEWRAEVTATEMAQLKPGMTVTVNIPDVGGVQGAIRQLAPTLDTMNRNGLVYVDLQPAGRQAFRAGMFARGEFTLGRSHALTVPQEAISMREGFSYLFRLDDQTGDLARVSQIKVQLGRRDGDTLEVLSGLNADDRLVAAGATFLADGDSVKVLE
ncbi:MAG: efflux RND transporter periplasmic adaptor subunit [Methylococcales bacterium]|nr:efflux RND transporter periplasmic adaptor subunit [Methylococcales bacterium]